MGVRKGAVGIAVLAALAALPALAETRRVAIVVGNNAGGEAAPLRYAENDAGKFARVMVEDCDFLSHGESDSTAD